jgi:hypothetical protein
MTGLDARGSRDRAEAPALGPAQAMGSGPDRPLLVMICGGDAVLGSRRGRKARVRRTRRSRRPGKWRSKSPPTAPLRAPSSDSRHAEQDRVPRASSPSGHASRDPQVTPPGRTHGSVRHSSRRSAPLVPDVTRPRYLGPSGIASARATRDLKRNRGWPCPPRGAGKAALSAGRIMTGPAWVAAARS